MSTRLCGTKKLTLRVMREVPSIHRKFRGRSELLHGENARGHAKWRTLFDRGPYECTGQTKPSVLESPRESGLRKRRHGTFLFKQESHRSKARPEGSDWKREEEFQ